MADIISVDTIDYGVNLIKEAVIPIGKEVFEVYMRQVYIEGITSIGLGVGIILVTMLMGIAWLIIGNMKSTKEFNGDGDAIKMRNTREFEECWYSVLIFGTIIFIIVDFFCFLFALDGFKMVYNPEYYVIQMLLDAVGV